MKPFGSVRRLLRLRVRRQDVDREIDDEIESHLALCIDWLVARGMPRDDAEREAARRFGNLEQARRRLHASAAVREDRMRLREWLGSVRDDLRYALRQMSRAPGFAATAIATLALGIGANAAMFGVADRLLLRPPSGVSRPEGVKRLYFTQTYTWAGTATGAYTSYGDYLTLRDGLHDDGNIAIYFTSRASMGRGPDAIQVSRTLATPSFFPLLGVRPALGRLFAESEERIPLGEPVAVLSYGFWQRQYGGDRAVLGRTIQLGARQYHIIGVARRDFSGVDLEPTDVWVPFSAAGSELGGDNWYRPNYWTGPTILLRPRAGVSSRRIEAQATAIFRHTLDVGKQAWTVASKEDSTARVQLGSIIAGRAPPGAWDTAPRITLWLFAMAGVVLLIACGNVTNLLLARAAARRTEMAVRSSLGASRARLVRQLFVDTTLLVVLGAVAGLAAGLVGDRLIRSLLLPGSLHETSLIDHRLLAFTLLVTTVAALIAGLSPALAASRLQLTEALKGDARVGHREYHRSRVRDAMVLLQAALSVVLLIGAGLFVRSLKNVLALDLGFDVRHVAMASINFSNSAFTPGEVENYYYAAAQRLQSVPGVQATALANAIPFWSSHATSLVVPGHPTLPITKDGGPYVVRVTPDYFAAVRTRIVRGRGFTAADRKGAAGVAIVSETMARLVWPGEEALGKCMKVGGDAAPCSTVIGIAHDARRQSLEAVAVMQYYLPLAQDQEPPGDLSVLVRASGDPSVLVAPIRQVMASIIPDLPFVDVRPLQSLLDPSIQPWRIGAGVFVAFGAVALLIAAVGLYGVIAYEVAQRTHEFGIRAALGATASAIVAQVLRRGVGLALAGIVIGLGIARLGAPWLAPLLFDTSATAPTVFVTVGAVLLAVAVAACFVPARRAAQTDPAAALRTD